MQVDISWSQRVCVLSGTAPEYPSPFKKLVSGPLFTVGQPQKAIQKGSGVPVARQHSGQAWHLPTPPSACLVGFFLANISLILDLQSCIESILWGAAAPLWVWHLDFHGGWSGEKEVLGFGEMANEHTLQGPASRSCFGKCHSIDSKAVNEWHPIPFHHQPYNVPATVGECCSLQCWAGFRYLSVGILCHFRSPGYPENLLAFCCFSRRTPVDPVSSLPTFDGFFGYPTCPGHIGVITEPHTCNQIWDPSSGLSFASFSY